MAPHRSAERKRKSLHARIEKLNFEQSIRDRLRLSDQLVQPLLDNVADAVIVDVDAVSSTRRLSIDQHAKPQDVPGVAGPMTICRSRA